MLLISGAAGRKREEEEGVVIHNDNFRSHLFIVSTIS